VPLGIDLHCIPAGATDPLQPLDRRVFRVQKSHARRLFRMRVREDHFRRRTKQRACEDVVAAWQQLSLGALEAGWDIYQEGPWGSKKTPK
jgi:hypothetical protein